eukprot:g10261.t1
MCLQSMFADRVIADNVMSRGLWESVVSRWGVRPADIAKGEIEVSYWIVLQAVGAIALLGLIAGTAWQVFRGRRSISVAVADCAYRGWLWWLLPALWESLRVAFSTLGWAAGLSLLLTTLPIWLAVTFAGWLATLLTVPAAGSDLGELSGKRAAWSALGVLCAVYVVGFTWMNWQLYWALEIPHGDSAMYEEHLWNLTHGKGFRSYLDNGRLFLGEHVQVIHIALVPFHAIWPSQLLLELCESLALAAGAVPVFLIARRHAESNRVAVCLAAIYLLAFPLHFLDISIDTKTFRPISFGVPLMLFALDQWERGRLKTMVGLLLLAISAKEDFAVMVSMLGIWIAVTAWWNRETDSKERRRNKWFGIGLAVFGAVYVFLVIKLVIPAFRDGDPHYFRYFGELGSSPGDVLARLQSNPEVVLLYRAETTRLTCRSRPTRRDSTLRLRNNNTDMPADPTADLGTMTCNLRGSIPAGSYQSCVLKYTAGYAGIDDTGSLKVVMRYPTDAGRPQFDDPAAPNYTTAVASNGAHLQLRYDLKDNRRPWGKTIHLKVLQGYLRKGDSILLTIGDQSAGSPGWRMQTFLEDTFELRTLVDRYATYVYEQLPKSPTFRIAPGEPATLVAVAPTVVKRGRKIVVRQRLEDCWGNPIGKSKRSTHEGFHETGVYTIPVTDELTGLSAETNPIVVREQIGCRHYWADLHGQTEETIGTNTIDDYFRFARDVAFLDACAHQGNDFQITDRFWEKIQSTTKSFNKPGRFVTFPGWEWSGNTGLGGDRNVLFKEEGGFISRSSRALVAPGEAAEPCSDAVEDLFDRLERDKRDVMMFAHVGGRYADLNRHREGLETAVEVHSAWGTFEWMLDDAFRLGYRVAVVANSDGHKGRPGASHPGASTFGSYGGLTCILADELDRDSVWEAYQSRRVYATTGARIVLDISAVTDDGVAFPMGVELGAQKQSVPLLRGSIHGTAPIERVEIRNGSRVVQVLRNERTAGDSNRVKLLWQGAEVRGRGRQVCWDGELTVARNRIRRFHTINFHNLEKTCRRTGKNQLAWNSLTTGGVAGVILELEKATGELQATEYRDNVPFPEDGDSAGHHICFVGDSFTFGHGIPDVDDRFSNVIRKRLQEKQPGQFVVSNLARAGTDVEWVDRLQKELFDDHRRIDTFVYVICLNDIERLHEGHDEFYGRINGRKPDFFLFRDTYFFNLMYLRARLFTVPEVKDYYSFVSEFYTGKPWDKMETILDRMHRRCRERGADFRIVIFPGQEEAPAARPGRNGVTGSVAHMESDNADRGRRRLAVWMLAIAMSLGLTIVFWMDLWRGGGLIGGDTYTYFYPQKVYFAERLAAGEFPLWNRLAGHGYPLVAESQTGALYPCNVVLYRLFDVTTAYNIVQISHYVLTFLFTWMYARRFGQSNRAALFAAVAFTYSWFPFRISLEWAVVSGAWLPAALWCTESLLQTRWWRYAILLACVLALQMLAGHFNLAFITQLLLAVYIPGRLWFARRPVDADSSRSNTFLLCVAGILFGFALAAVQLLPTWELKKQSQRAEVGGAHNPGYGHTPIWYWSQAVAPWSWYGLGIDLNSRLPDDAPLTNDIEAHLYFGLIPLALFLCGLLGLRMFKQRELLLWLLIGIAALFYTTGWFLPVTQHLPGFSFFMGPGRYSILTTLAVSIIAAAVLDRWMRVSSLFRREFLFVLVVAGTLVDLLMVARMVPNAVIVDNPPVDAIEQSEIRRLLLNESEPVRLFCRGPNLPTLIGVSSTPQYLGIGPAAYFDPDVAMPLPFPFDADPDNPNDDAPTAEQVEWLRNAGVTHVLSFTELDDARWPVTLLWQGGDAFFNRAWGRREPFFLYRLNGARGRAYWKDPTTRGVIAFEEFRADNVRLKVESAAGGRLSIEGELPSLSRYHLVPGESLDTKQQRLVRLTRRVASTVPTIGNNIELLSDTNRTLGLIEQAIHAAKETLHLEYYIWQPDQTGSRMRDLLIEKAKQGVTVRFLYDKIGSMWLGKKFLQPMREAGIHVAAFLPGASLRERWSINLRSHRKIVIVDGRIGFTGGMNIGDEYLGKDPKLGYWRDTHLRMTGPVVLQLQQVFARDWYFATREQLTKPELYPQPEVSGTHLAQVISGEPSGDVDAFYAIMFAAINQAQERITLATSYFVPPIALVTALESAAFRGVKVRLLLTGRSAQFWTMYAARSYYDSLLEAGVEIFEYERGLLHSKTLTIDGNWSLVGTPNFDARSLFLNFEVGVASYGTAMALELEEHFENDLNWSKRIDLKMHEARPNWIVLAENFCRLFAPVLDQTPLNSETLPDGRIRVVESGQGSSVITNTAIVSFNRSRSPESISSDTIDVFSNTNHPSRVRIQPSDTESFMKFAICQEMFVDWEWERQCKLIGEIGYTGVEVAPFALAPRITDVNAERRRELRRIAEDNGLQIIGLHWLLAKTEGLHLTTSDADVRAATADYLIDLGNACADLGGDLMVFGSPFQRNLEDGMSIDTAEANAAEVFRKAMPLLAERNVRICMEPLTSKETNFVNTCADAMRLVEMVDSPFFQLHQDVKAMLGAEPESIPVLIEKYAEHVGHFHVNDTNLLGPGMGDTDYLPIFEALLKTNYSGWVSVEVFDYEPGAEHIARVSFDYMQDVLSRAAQ